MLDKGRQELLSVLTSLSSVQIIINNGALPCLLNLLTSNNKKSIKKEACWTISNITAGNKEQIQVSASVNNAFRPMSLI